MSKAHKIEKLKLLISTGCYDVYVLTQPYLRVDIDSIKFDSTTDKASFKQPRLLIGEADDAQWTVIRKALMHTFADAVLIRAVNREQLQELTREWEEFAWEIPKLILLNTDASKSTENWQLVTDLKSLDAPLNQTPIIMFICPGMQPAIVEAYQRGCSVCILQPTTPKEWSECLKELRRYWWDTIAFPPMHLRLPF